MSILLVQSQSNGAWANSEMSILYEAKLHSQRLPVASLFEQGMLTERRKGSVQLTSTFVSTFDDVWKKC